MRLAVIDGRAALVRGDDPTALQTLDVAQASGGRFGPEAMAVFADWPAFADWASTAAGYSDAHDVKASLGAPVPAPRQVFAIGLNYRAHAAESNMEVPSVPATFTKFPASLTGPFADVTVQSDTTDYEVELVVVIGTECRNVAAADAWSHVAGVTIGQDLSDRELQFAAGRQFSLGKSRIGYGPIGPWVVSVDELANPDDLGLSDRIGDEVLQNSRTSSMIFDVPALISSLSSYLTLYPGDIIFTGTPEGVGQARTPPRFLQPGETLVSTIEGIGTIETRLG